MRRRRPIAYGEMMATNPLAIDDAVYDNLRRYFTEPRSSNSVSRSDSSSALAAGATWHMVEELPKQFQDAEARSRPGRPTRSGFVDQSTDAAPGSIPGGPEPRHFTSERHRQSQQVCIPRCAAPAARVPRVAQPDVRTWSSSAFEAVTAADSVIA